MHYDMSTCKECKKPFKNLKNHLMKKESCKSGYNMDKLNEQIETQRKQNKLESQRKRREYLVVLL